MFDSLPISVAERFKAKICGRSVLGLRARIPQGARMFVLGVVSKDKEAKYRTIKTKEQRRMKYRVQENMNKKDSQWNPWKYLSCLIILSAFNSSQVHSTSNRNVYRGILPASTADKSVVLIVQVKVRLGAQYSIPPLSLHGFLRQSFTFTHHKMTITKVFLNSHIVVHNLKMACLTCEEISGNIHAFSWPHLESLYNSTTTLNIS